MKRFFSIVTLLVLGLLVNAQISTKEMPRSFAEKENVGFASKVLSSPDVETLLAEDEENANFFKMQRCAVAVPMFEDFFDNAQHTSFNDYDLYILKVTIPYAHALGFSSDNFYLPKGTEFYIYNPDHSKVLGAYTSDNNSEDGIFATEYVYGDEIIMEYYQPKKVEEQAKIELSEFVYFYRDVVYIEQEQASMFENKSEIPQKDFRQSGSCNVNVNCSEGNNYQDVKNAVMRIEIKGGYNYYWCSGTVINTTDNSKLPYVLSAAHCVENSTSSDYRKFIFYFNYEASSCSTPSYGNEPSYISYQGCTLLAYDTTYGDNGTDYLLVKLKNNFTESHNPYFAGWSRSNFAPNEGVGIHHPSGDIKKISTFTSQPTSAEAYISTHWLVYWAQTTNGFGIVEGGSSGSGLFNTNGLLVGTLTGGYSDCDNGQYTDYQKDWYGRFGLQFQHLSQWIDSTNTGDTIVNGIYYNQTIVDTNTSSLNTLKDSDINFAVFPTVAKDYINISHSLQGKNAVVSILNNLGQTMLSYKIPVNQQTAELDISSLTSGVYFVRLYVEGNSYVQKIVKK